MIIIANFRIVSTNKSKKIEINLDKQKPASLGGSLYL
ncbi:hypothetical protein VPH5P1C_0148 [Vibrio phage 5P1c]